MTLGFVGGATRSCARMCSEVAGVQIGVEGTSMDYRGESVGGGGGWWSLEGWRVSWGGREQAGERGWKVGWSGVEGLG